MAPRSTSWFSLAKLSKNVIRQDRPSVTIDDEGQDDSDPATIARKQRHPKRKVKRTYGMPSTHSTSITFFMAYLLLSIPLYATSTRLPSERTHLIAKNVMMQLAIFAWGSAILWSRVRLGYHTLAQVAVGAGLGLAWGVGWRWAWDHLVKNGANVPVWAAHAYKSLGLATGPSLQQQGQWTIDKAFELIGLS